MTHEKQTPEESQADNILNADYRDPKNNWPDEETNGNSTARYWGMDESTFPCCCIFHHS